jgi:hypothetical protein
MIDYEQLAQESALFPWLDSDCMSDSYEELMFNNNYIETIEDEEV